MNIGNIGQITPSAEGEVKLNDVGESNDVGCGVSTGVNIGGQNGVELRTSIHTDGQNSKNDCGVEYRDMNMDDCGIVDNSEMIVECEFVRGTCKNHRIKGTRKVTSTKKWTKKKHGFGWVTQKKVTYSCPVGLQSSSSNNQQTSRDPSLSSDVKQGGSYNSNNSDIQVEKREHEPD